MNIWGIHMGAHVGSGPIDEGYVAIGWSALGDLSLIKPNRDAYKAQFPSVYPNTKEGSIPVQAGVLYRFTNEIKAGDIAIYPSKDNRMVNIGCFEGEYFYAPNVPNGYPNRRNVKWLASIPRDEFPQAALNEIGSAVTLFKVKNHSLDFLSRVGLAKQVDVREANVEIEDDEMATEDVSRQAVETTNDFIIRQIKNRLGAYEFEHFIAHILECMGYTARVTDKSGDGGVDVIAHTDELGFQPPIIKVQCKQITSQSSEPEVSQLLGTLGEGEFALYINLGSYSRPARILERNRAKLRLIDGEQLVDLILEHYQKLSPRYRTLIPLKQIYVPDLSV